jgi:hypothetical protein
LSEEEKVLMTIHTMSSLAHDFNCETIIPQIWHPPTFDRPDWQWIKNIAQASPKNDAPVRDVKVGSGPDAMRLNCQHRTQPRRNCTVFYRRIAENTIMVLGLGRHPGKSNKEYVVDWADGSRSRITLDKKMSGGSEFLSNPIGGSFGFLTLDPVVNALHRASA